MEFDEFYKKHIDSLTKFVNWYGPDDPLFEPREYIDDAILKAFKWLYKNKYNYISERKVRDFAKFKIISDWYRSPKNKPKTEPYNNGIEYEPADPQQPPNPKKMGKLEERRMVLRSWMKECGHMLAPIQRLTSELYCFEGLTIEKIAEKRGVAPRTVHKTLKEGMKKLAECIIESRKLQR